MKKIYKSLIVILSIFHIHYSFSEEKASLRLGIIKNRVTDIMINEVSVDSLVLEMLEKELGYDVEPIYGELDEMHEKFDNGELDILYPLEKSRENEKRILLSQSFYNENLYIGSSKIKITSLSDLERKTIYTTKGTTFKNKLKKILISNGIDAEIKEVKDLKNYAQEIIVASESSFLSAEHRLKIGAYSYFSIAATHGNEEIIKKINSLLRNSWGTRLRKHFNTVKYDIRRQYFYNYLTEEEKQYLKNLKVLKIGYDENSTVSHYDPKKKNYGGAASVFYKKIAEIFNLKIDVITGPYESWESALKKFRNGQLDIICMTNTESRMKKNLFTQKVSELFIYKIDRIKNPLYMNKKRIGVLKDTIEHEIASEYFEENELLTYEKFDNMAKDLKNGRLDSLITFDGFLVEGNEYETKVFTKVPINFAIRNEDYLLKNIIDKAIEHVLDKEELIEEFSKEQQLFFRKRVEDTRLYSLLLKVAGAIFTFISIFGGYRIYREKKNAEFAFIDHLTGLDNRYRYDSFCSENDLEGTAIVIDLDNFKVANDRHGHFFGDEIIILYSKLLKEIFKNEKIFRISGDEFYIFTRDKEVEKLLKLLKEKFEKSEAFSHYSVSCSIGYYKVRRGQSIAKAFKYADMAMYNAKSIHGVSFEEATKEFIKIKKRETMIKESLKKSIDEEIYPVFQPKISVSDGKSMIGAEALARWNSTLLGSVSPVEFIPAAEELKSIGKIDLKIAEKAMEQLKSWLDQERVGKDFKMSFNISMYTFENENIVEKISNLLKKYNLEGKNIEVELTESIVSRRLNQTIMKLRELKDLGITISLDDFTAGHSTAGILPLIPVDIVKLDRSLMRSIKTEKEKGSMVYKTLIKLVKDMGLKMTAEGVEEENEFDFLRAHGVDYVQGFFFSKPLTAEELELKRFFEVKK